VAHFSKILIANRGEIAVRIARTARALGYRTVAVFSDADRTSPHVAACDEAVALGGTSAAESYLAIERVVAAAARSGASAVHPGYGFLSENADFAEACATAGLTFIGPPAAAIRLMGNKAAAKARMLEAGVPCVPGYQGAQDDRAFADAARDIGYPVMLKAAAGGGGKGMRLVTAPEAFAAALEATRTEARRAFGSDELLLEKALHAPRHVEIQIFGDTFGTLVHLGERDCSIQRRHQKIIEEAPSPAVSDALRERMGGAAIAAGRAAGYVGAGTVEFLLDDAGAFYFLEMNTRLQVEHAVTEAIAGIDLVAWQLRVAAGEPLPPLDPQRPRAAHAIEARLYAEDPASGFLPQAGRIVRWQPPLGAGIRVDHALADGLEISPYYDPMLAKVVAEGTSREEARRRLIAALEDLVAYGVATNRRFLIDCLERPAFINGEARTDFVARHAGMPDAAPQSRTSGDGADSQALALAALLFAHRARGHGGEPGWRSSAFGATYLKLGLGDASAAAAGVFANGGAESVTLGGEPFDLTLLEDAGGRVRYEAGGLQRAARYAWDGERLFLSAGRDEFCIVDLTFAGSARAAGAQSGSATAPMPGIVSKVTVVSGEAVAKGQTLVVLEAMKMLHEIVAPAAGVVANVLVSAGQQVGLRAVLVEIETPGAADAPKEQAP
jgi:geranyl-CoA carboxylase alpha subunit